MVASGTRRSSFDLGEKEHLQDHELGAQTFARLVLRVVLGARKHQVKVSYFIFSSFSGSILVPKTPTERLSISRTSQSRSIRPLRRSPRLVFCFYVHISTRIFVNMLGISEIDTNCHCLAPASTPTGPIQPNELIAELPPAGISMKELIVAFDGRIGEAPGRTKKAEFIALVKQHARLGDGKLLYRRAAAEG
jgi:hypothetical protein